MRMKDRIRTYPMIILLLPLVAAILFSERNGWLYPAEYEAYDSTRVYTFVLTSESKPTAKCERFESRCAAGDVYLYLLRDSSRTMPEKGDTVIAQTSIRRPQPIGGFDSPEVGKHRCQRFVKDKEKKKNHLCSNVCTGGWLRQG